MSSAKHDFDRTRQVTVILESTLFKEMKDMGWHYQDIDDTRSVYYRTGMFGNIDNIVYFEFGKTLRFLNQAQEHIFMDAEVSADPSKRKFGQLVPRHSHHESDVITFNSHLETANSNIIEKTRSGYSKLTR